MKKKTVVSSLAAAIVVFFLTLTGATAAQYNLLINEIFNQPDDYNHEFIEIYNNSDYDLRIVDWLGLEVLDDITLNEFPSDAIIKSGEYILCVRDADSEAWDDLKAQGIQIFEFDLSLANTTGTIQLLSNSCGAPSAQDTVTFDNDAPWPEDVDHDIHSIELINPNLDNDNGANWAESSVEGGTPGAANSVLIP